MPIKILLIADVHLGLKFASYGDKKEEMSEARYETLEKAVTLANDEECNLLTIAGDLFDRLNVADRDVIRTTQILNKFKGNLVAVLPGNHDFLTSDMGRLWKLFKERAGDNILLLTESKAYNLKYFDVDATLYAGVCDAKHSDTNRINWIKDERKDPQTKYHIGIAHGSMIEISPDEERKYFSMTQKELLDCGLDIWLLGHTDRRTYPERPDNMSKIFFPGTHEPNGFECRHKGNVWVLEINESKEIKAKPITTGKYYFKQANEKISNETELYQIREKYTSNEYLNCILRLNIEGRLKEELFQEMDEIIKRIEENVFYLEENRENLKKEITKELIDREYSLLSFPHQLLCKLIENNEKHESLDIAYDLLKEIRE